MGIEGKNHHPNPVKDVRVGQSSRRDASPATCSEPKFNTYTEEYDWINQQIRGLDEQLTSINLAISKRVAAVGSCPRETMFQQQRRELIAKKNALTVRGQSIKTRVKAEIAEGTVTIEGGFWRLDGSVDLSALGIAIWRELKTIRELMEAQQKEGQCK